MAYPFPPMLDQLVREELATGVYRSEDEVLVEAMQRPRSGRGHCRHPGRTIRPGRRPSAFA